MNTDFKTQLIQELPELLENDPAVRESVWRLITPYFAPRQQTDSRFDEMMAELRRMREDSERKWAEQKAESERKWAEQDRKWWENQEELRRMREDSERKWAEQKEKEAEQDRKWWENQEELRRMREESERKWAEEKVESERKWAEQDRKWWENQEELRRMREESERKWAEEKAESERKWAEQDRKWWENQEELRRMREESERKWAESKHAIGEQEKLFHKTIGALGARWGIFSEESFRQGLAAILSDISGVEVNRVEEYDEDGEVFGTPENIELDVVVKNGLLILCEIKSSITYSELFVFERKARFYERRHNRPITQKMVISPMIDKRAIPAAERWGIRLYSYPEDVEQDALQPPPLHEE